MPVPLPDPPPPGRFHPPRPYNVKATEQTPNLPIDPASPELAARGAAAAGKQGYYLDLPPEVSLAEAASIANCDKKTVIRYLRDGLLEWRNIAPPSSGRPTYRIKLSSVIALRTAYRTGSPRPDRKKQRHDDHSQPKPARPGTCHQFKHIRFGRG